ncbi:hypothetical protein N7524_011807 [Penicillium chrysogenum]|nr:hypothetical protein N7524_011807 [Penicillium chrysogenum]
MGLQSSPPMRHFFGQEEGPDRIIGVVVTKKFLDDKRRKELLSIVTMLYNEPTRSHFGLPTLIDALDILIQRETYVKEMISPYMMGTISDLSVMTECLREISVFQPWAVQFEHTKAKYAEPLGRDWAATVKGWILFGSDPVNLDLATLGAPTGKRFFYPTDKPRTLKSTAEMQQAEANLDEFWKIVDTEIRLKDATLCSAIGRQLLGTSRLLYRTPDWVEPAKAPKKYVGQSSEHSQTEVDFELMYRTRVTPKSDRIHSNIRTKKRETSQAPPVKRACHSSQGA